MSHIDTELSNFVSEERGHFEVEDDNNFATAFCQILRYWDFLTIIRGRHKFYNREFFKLMGVQEKLFALGGGSVEERSAWYDENGRLCTYIQFEIESYYLFAKILIDKIAHFIEFFFGSVRRLSLDSHDDLTKDFAVYRETKGLRDYERFEKCLMPLKTEVSDFRDYQIAHEKSPRTIRGVCWSVRDETSIVLIKCNPRETDVRAQGKSLDKLEEDLQIYLREMMSLIRANRDKSKLRRRAA